MIRIRRKDNRATAHIVRNFDPKKMLSLTLCGRLLYTADYQPHGTRLGTCDACARIEARGKIVEDPE
jgi:hypothetical protein